MIDLIKMRVQKVKAENEKKSLWLTTVGPLLCVPLFSKGSLILYDFPFLKLQNKPYFI